MIKYPTSIRLVFTNGDILYPIIMIDSLEIAREYSKKYNTSLLKIQCLASNINNRKNTNRYGLSSIINSV